MSENNIKSGDYVRLKAGGKVCKAMVVGERMVAVDETREFATTYNLEDVERIDPKTAFLTELKDLLDKYNASIYVDFDQSDEIYTTTIAVGEDSVKYYHTYGIDTDNVFNYDK